MQEPLIIRLPNWVGDVVMCLPALKLLQQLNIPIICIGRPWAKDLLFSLNIPVYFWPKKYFQAIKLLKNIPGKHMLLFTNSFSSALVAKLAGKKACGFATDGRSWLLNQAIKKPINQHETDLFNLLTKQCLQAWRPGLTLIDFDKYPALQIAKQDQEQLPNKYIVLCPFAHGTNPNGESKRWPYWQELATQLTHLNPVICPGPNEITEAQANFAQIQQITHLNLQEYLHILNNAEFIIANDSGPMHMACAVGTPTIAIFGATDEKRTGPRNAIIVGKAGNWPNTAMILHQINILSTNYK